MARNKRGRFITLEGGEGAGKSTNARFIRDWLTARGREVVLTREPGGSPMAEAIREVVLRDWKESMAPDTELLLMFAARASHLHSVILPALAAGKDVVCDRFIDSTYAYQGAGKQMPVARIKLVDRMVLGTFAPDLTLLFDLPPEEGLKRAHARGEKNRFEAESLAYMRRVRACFLQRARSAPGRYAVIRANRPLPAVQKTVARVLEQKL
ncbi:MAG TPA: dTMP kinase [Nevskiaceae bacterium]|nr:dTMP kinase [Nevskiaceae bacterium]